MTFEIPSVSELKHAAEDGQRITPADVSSISQAESELTGRGPVRGGPAGRAGIPGHPMSSRPALYRT